MHINVISESVFFEEKVGGIYSAFLTTVQLLKKKKLNVSINSLGKADITHIHSIGPYAWYKLFFSKHVVVSSHWVPESSLGTYIGAKLLQPFIRGYLKYFYNKADLVLALTPKARADLINLGIKTRIEVLPNPINTKIFKIDKNLRKQGRAKYQIKQHEFVILGSGQFIPRKGIEDFILLARKFPKYLFVWAGGSAAFKLINAKIKNENELIKSLPPNLILIGNVSYKEMPMVYNMADIFLFPSYQETQGLVIMEAAACGLPLVLRNLQEYNFLYGKSYISCKNLQDFSKALVKLFSDKKYYQTYHEESLKIAAKFSTDNQSDKLISYYTSLFH